ncbi:hypothetical protein BU14_0025s0005 [Porphyra umbilicalis]|uniref:Uncharacterized protein n=1 Tax=Porphyra umbilicalis TaxID=2786 RepID=A0A1X6PJS9_PORUM|nr:hypothetical protein BU14_0025s0005 [Porphyra umbilicalis]|eukprot:OSX81122.1 hypothetical protein BU14_0025s0005 [Porphyra umbilicalis]
MSALRISAFPVIVLSLRLDPRLHTTRGCAGVCFQDRHVRFVVAARTDCKRRASHEGSLTQPSSPRVLVSEAVACVAAPTAHVPRAATSTALRWPSSSFLPFLLAPLTSSLSLLPSTFSPHVCFRGWSRA